MTVGSAVVIFRRAALIVGTVAIVWALLLLTLACGVALSGRIDIGDDVGTETASPCP
jgi:hypothetical protein